MATEDSQKVVGVVEIEAKMTGAERARVVAVVFSPVMSWEGPRRYDQAAAADYTKTTYFLLLFKIRSKIPVLMLHQYYCDPLQIFTPLN